MSTSPDPRLGRPWRILVAHGAGSTATTAASLLAGWLPAPVASDFGATPRHDWHLVEDRTGDVDVVAERIRSWLIDSASQPGPRVVCGVSMGAHAIMLALSRFGPADRRHLPNACVVALPAWTGEPDGTAEATASSGRHIGAIGAAAMLAAISRETPRERQWLLERLRHDWSNYSDGSLSRVLITAARGKAPGVAELSHVRIPTLVIAARDDPLHPITVARTWTRALPRATLVDIDLFGEEGGGAFRPGGRSGRRTQRTIDQFWERASGDSTAGDSPSGVGT